MQLSCLQLLQHFDIWVGVGAMLQRLQATGSMLAALQGRPGFDKVAQKEATKFKDLLLKAEEGEEDWPGICDLVRKVGFEAADADALLDIVVMKMSSGDSLPKLGEGKVSRTTTQKFESCMSFLTAAVWDKIAEGHTTELFEHLCKLGLRSPSETTSATMAMAVLHITDGAEAAMAMQPCVRTKFIKTIKYSFKALAKKQPKVEAYIALLPPTVEQFRILWPAVYDIAFKDAPPVASRVLPIALDGLKSTTPMRATKGHIVIAAPRNRRLHAAGHANLGPPNFPDDEQHDGHGHRETTQPSAEDPVLERGPTCPDDAFCIGTTANHGHSTGSGLIGGILNPTFAGNTQATARRDARAARREAVN